MRTLNLGILAHVDAGKTSLTERLLHAAGAIDQLGSVDHGSTVTDSLDLERRRGITIRSAVASFAVGDVTVNLIDTPGHPDFVAEVERVLAVLDGAVLVVSAVEGVQAQTRVLVRTLRRLGIPVVVFVNKVDRAGARGTDLLADLAGQLDLRPVLPDVADDLLVALAEHDDDLLASYAGAAPPPPRQHLGNALAEQTRRALVTPVFFGSAVTGAGVAALTAGLTELLAAPATDAVADPLAGTVFKIERGPSGEKVAYLRLFSGTVRTRDRLVLRSPAGHRRPECRVTAISVFAGGPARPGKALCAGQIGQLRGPSSSQVGDLIGDPPRSVGPAFAPPSLETVVRANPDADRRRLHAALTGLAEQDPLIGFRREADGELAVSLYGEVQKEVLAATLADEFGISVTFRETTPRCVERVASTGSAAQRIGTDPNPFLATVGLRVQPAPDGSGVTFTRDVELGSMPAAFFTAVEEATRSTLQSGPHGWPVIDAVVTLTECGYWARQSHAHGSFDKSMSSTAGDFRGLTRLVLTAALERAGTTVHEPVHRFRLDLPADALGAVLPVLALLGAVPTPPDVRGSRCVLRGLLPAARVHELRTRLPGLTRGEGSLESDFHGYRPVPSRSQGRR